MATSPPAIVTGTVLAVGLGTLAALAGAGRRTTLSVAALLAAAHSIDAENWVRMALVHLAAWRHRGVAPTDVLTAHRALHVCCPIDLDQNAHMNNAKYVKLLNYTRRAFWLQNGVWAVCARRSPPANMVVTATALRYRRQIRCFERFLVVTRLLYWGDIAFYLEHRFESLTDGFVSCACYARTGLTLTCCARSSVGRVYR